MTGTAYLAGPDVFLPNAVAHAATKVEICRRLGLRGLPPLNEDAETAATELEVWQAIYEKDVAMMGYHCQPHAVRRRIRRCGH
jgi:nucleoside 2-deoxyribosyltransferase